MSQSDLAAGHQLLHDSLLAVKTACVKNHVLPP